MDPFVLEVGNGEEAVAVVLAAGDALGDALVRPGRVVVHLVLGQDGAQVCFASDFDPGGLFGFYAARPSSRRARWLVRRRSSGVPVQ